MDRELASHEVVTVALFLLGGDSHAVDTEDIAVKAQQLAPGRFSWRKHKDQINLEVIRVYLSDAKKDAKGSYVIGSGNAGWLLTPAGVSFAKRIVSSSPALLDPAHRRAVGRDLKQLQHERIRLLSSLACQKVSRGSDALLTHSDAEEFFRIDSYVTGEARKQRIARMVNAHGDDPELGPIIRLLLPLLERGKHEP